MKNKILYIIPVAIVAVVLSQINSEMILLKPMATINLGTLLMAFPVVLALTERFNEIFVVSKDQDATKEKNIFKTSVASFCVGLLLAVAGFRILETFMEIPFEAHFIQKGIFIFIDTVLTAVVIAGGTDGWHQLVGLLQDVTKAKRGEFKPEKLED